MQPALSVRHSGGAAEKQASPGLVSRVRRRLFPPHGAASGSSPHKAPGKGISFQASIAEFLLVNRLRARSKRDTSAEMLERASHIVFVTCQNWFTQPEEDASLHRHTSYHQTRL